LHISAANLGARSVARRLHEPRGTGAALQRGMNDRLELEIITLTDLHTATGGAPATQTTIRAPLSGKTTVKQNIGVNLPKGPVEMTWGARTFWGDFSWTFKAGR
jgi:hypothetical protein